MRPHRKASGTARGEGLRGPAPLDSPPAAKAEPWNHHAAMTSPQGSPRPHGPRETDGTGAPASATHAVRLTAPGAMGSWTRFARGSDCAFPLRAPTARSTRCRLRPPTVGFGRKTEPAGRGPSPIFFWTVRLRRIDHTGVAPPVNVAVSPKRIHARLMTGTALAGNAIA